jgi:membrane protein implicated in regulation of membrane protease activity
MDINPVIIWFVAGLVLILSEFMLPGVVLVFFGAGAWLTALTSWLGLTPGWSSQLLVFGVSSVLLIVLLRRRLRLRFFGHVGGEQDPVDNLDELAGEHVVVTRAVTPEDGGQVEYKGAAWQARSETPLEVGQRAVVTAVDGITLIVRPRS